MLHIKNDRWLSLKIDRICARTASLHPHRHQIQEDGLGSGQQRFVRAVPSTGKDTIVGLWKHETVS